MRQFATADKRKRKSRVKLGTAAKRCKGRSASSFRSCVRRVMRGGKA